MVHRMTLSARLSTFGGIVKPIWFAAFKLMINSNFPRLLHGQVGRFRSLQNSVQIRGSAPVQVGNVNTVSHESQLLRGSLPRVARVLEDFRKKFLRCGPRPHLGSLIGRSVRCGEAMMGAAVRFQLPIDLSLAQLFDREIQFR